jgi:hypothetical protein
MLLANTMNRPKHVWDETKKWLSDGILYRQRIIANNRGTIFTTKSVLLCFNFCTLIHLPLQACS